MIATQIENNLRRQLYGLFWRWFDPLETKVWQAKLIQCVEKNVRIDDTQCVMPDRYLISTASNITMTEDEKKLLINEIKEFIGDYAKESNYRIANDIRIDFITKRTSPSPGIEFYGWVSKVHNNDMHIHAAVYTVVKKNESIKLYDLPSDGKYLIGRAENAKIRLHHHCISCNHAQLIINKNGTVQVRDLQSVNGTYLQGKRLEPHKEHILTLPATVCFGGIYIIVVRRKSDTFQ